MMAVLIAVGAVLARGSFSLRGGAEASASESVLTGTAASPARSPD